MKNNEVIWVMILAFVVGVYFYFLVLFFEKTFIWILPVAYLIFFVLRDAKEEREELNRKLLYRETEKMSFDWRYYLV